MGDFGQLALEVTDVRLEVFALLHFNVEEEIIVLVSLLARGVLSEELFGYLLEVVKRMWRRGVNPILGHTFQIGC